MSVLHMTYEKAKRVKIALEASLHDAQCVINNFPKNEHGFTSDKVRFSRDYRVANRNYNNAHRALNSFLDAFAREFRADIQNEKETE